MSSLEQKIQAKLDELNKLKEKQRKKDNQQKIILGALVMKSAKKIAIFQNKYSILLTAQQTEIKIDCKALSIS